jgi:hypothetical protein
VLKQHGGNLRWYGVRSSHISRIGHLLALGIEDGDFHLGGGGILAGYLLQSGRGDIVTDMRRQEPGFASEGFIYLTTQGLLHDLAQGEVKHHHSQEKDHYKRKE